MANCPKCNKSVPCSQALTYIKRINEIECEYCGTKSLIKKKDIVKWWLRIIYVLISLTIVTSIITNNSDLTYTLVIIYWFGGIIFYCKVGWKRTILEKHDKQNKRK